FNPNHWATQFPKCGGLRQSPINIVTSKVHIDIALSPFNFIGHTDTINMTVENKGHSGNEEPILSKVNNFVGTWIWFFDIKNVQAWQLC
uniref:Alpha-carbonic anhydrase domain-containing protein n=1 Tax=Neolamprologus brichardi TaxID=32507 RepID=A0A3Q4GKN9_NEOBR